MSPRPSVEPERRRQILEAALACFARKGYHQTTMDDIAAQLPFSKGLLYYYFKTKRELFLAILENWMGQSIAVWKDILSPDDNAITQLRKGLEYSMQLLAQSADLARVEFEFYGEIGRDAQISGAFKTLFAQFRAEFNAILKAGVANGEFRPANTQAIAAILLGIYEGLAIQVMVDPTALDGPAITQELFDMVMRGIAVN